MHYYSNITSFEYKYGYKQHETTITCKHSLHCNKRQNETNTDDKSNGTWGLLAAYMVTVNGILFVVSLPRRHFLILFPAAIYYKLQYTF